jgi:hypothetical protein
MKKLTLIIALAIGSLSMTANDSFRMDESKLNQAFAQSIEVSFDEMYASNLPMVENDMFKSSADGEKTRGGFLLRAFFCGSFAIHRYYMGTTRGGMWAMYCCIPVVGGINGFVDFWWAVFESDAYTKYANNDKYIVWLD